MRSLNQVLVPGRAGTRWQLVGSVKLVRRLHPSWYAAAHTPNCLKLIRKPDALSPFLKSAMTVKSILSGVTIATPDGRVSLRNAQVMGVASSKHPSNQDTHELEEWSLSFQKIEQTFQTGSNITIDDWSEYPP